MTQALPLPPHSSPRTPERRGEHGQHAQPARWAALLALCCLALSACGPEVQGSPKPPEAFGAVQSSWFGCPALQGVYGWPPVDATGAYGSRPPNRRWGPGELPFYANGPEMQIWVQQRRGETTLRTRTINRARNVRSPLTRQWSQVTYGGAQIRCSAGMLDVVAQGAPPSDGEDAGDPKVQRGFRLALMKDGALAVGSRTLSTGNKGSYFSWGGQSYGSYDAPDVETWSWFKLARTDTGDREPPAIDAYVRGATAP